MKPIWIVIGLLLLAGCALSPETHTGLGTWVKPGGRPGAVERDSLECQQEARYPSYDDPSLQRGVLQSVMRMDQDLYAACMRARGCWQVDLTPSVTPEGAR